MNSLLTTPDQTQPLSSTLRLRDEVIVCFSESPWHSGVSGRQQISMRLARDNDVVYVDPPEHIEKMTRLSSWVSWRPQLEPTGPRLNVYRFPPWAGRTHKPWLERRLLRCRVGLLRHYLAKIATRPPMIFAFGPSAWPYVAEFADLFTCYHVYDHLNVHWGQDEEKRYRDDLLTRRANVVIAVSEPLAQQHQDGSRQTYVVYNGVDYDRYCSPCPPVPDAMRCARPPVLCVVTRLNELIDYDVLYHIVEEGHLHLVVVGPLRRMPDEQRAKANRLLSHANVQWVGEQPPTTIPAFVRHADVCLVPYRIQPATTVAATPQKLMEYLAAGKPIVAAALPPMRKFQGIIRFAESPDEWIRQIRQAWENDTAELRVRRQAMACDNSWDMQVARISSILAQKKHEYEQRGSQG